MKDFDSFWRGFIKDQVIDVVYDYVGMFQGFFEEYCFVRFYVLGERLRLEFFFVFF